MRLYPLKRTALLAFLLCFALPGSIRADSDWYTDADDAGSPISKIAPAESAYYYISDTETTESEELNVSRCDHVGFQTFNSASSAGEVTIWEVTKGSADEQQIYASDVGIVNLDADTAGQIGVFWVEADRVIIKVAVAASSGQDFTVKAICK